MIVFALIGLAAGAIGAAASKKLAASAPAAPAASNLNTAAGQALRQSILNTLTPTAPVTTPDTTAASLLARLFGSAPIGQNTAGVWRPVMAPIVSSSFGPMSRVGCPAGQSLQVSSRQPDAPMVCRPTLPLPMFPGGAK